MADGLRLHPTKDLLFAGTGDGATAYDKTGALVGKIIVPGGIAQLVFANQKTLILLDETQVLRADFDV